MLAAFGANDFTPGHMRDAATKPFPGYRVQRPPGQLIDEIHVKHDEIESVCSSIDRAALCNQNAAFLLSAISF
jgi:hypothetical protein